MPVSFPMHAGLCQGGTQLHGCHPEHQFQLDSPGADAAVRSGLKGNFARPSHVGIRGLQAGVVLWVVLVTNEKCAKESLMQSV